VTLELSYDVHVPTFGDPDYDMAEAQQISDDEVDAVEESEDAD
jgi:predicted membrane-bound spermidine synthase